MKKLLLVLSCVAMVVSCSKETTPEKPPKSKNMAWFSSYPEVWPKFETIDSMDMRGTCWIGGYIPQIDMFLLDEQGNDLLSPATKGSVGTDDIAIYYLNDKGERVDYKHLAITEPNNVDCRKYYIASFLLYSDMASPTMYIEWGNGVKDELRIETVVERMNVCDPDDIMDVNVVNKAWYNGTLIYDAPNELKFYEEAMPLAYIRVF